MSAISGELLPASIGRWGRALVAAALLLPMFAAQAQTTRSTALAASPASSAYGQSVTLTVTVAGDNPSGSVSLADAGTTLGSAALNAGVATLPVSSLAVGAHSLTAVYGGDASLLMADREYRYPNCGSVPRVGGKWTFTVAPTLGFIQLKAVPV